MSVERYDSRKPNRIDIEVLENGFIVPEASSTAIASWKAELTEVVDEEFMPTAVAGLSGIYAGRPNLSLFNTGAALPPLFANPDDLFGGEALANAIQEGPQEPSIMNLLVSSHTAIAIARAATTFKQAATETKPHHYKLDIPDDPEQQIRYTLLLDLGRIPTNITMTTAPGKIDFRVNLLTSTQNPVRGSDYLQTSLRVDTQSGRTKITSGANMLTHNPHPNPDPILVVVPLDGIAMSAFVANTIQKTQRPPKI